MNHYEKLGISKSASQKEIKDAYKKLVKKYHPDVYPGDKSFAEKKIKEINLAYDILSNIDTKQAYDDEINPSPRYNYTPPKYNNPESYSYHSNYKSKINQTYHSYEEFDNYKRYSKYHRSKTPNSNYTTKIHDDFSNNVINSITKMQFKTKIIIILIIIILYCCFFISTFLKFTSLFNGEETGTILDTHKTSPQTNIVLTNTINSNNPTTFLTRDDFNINDYFSEDELMDVYNEYYQSEFESYDDFKETLSDYLYYNYY